MSRIYESIMAGLTEALEYARGDKTKCRENVYSEEEIKQILSEKSKNKKSVVHNEPRIFY